MIKELRIGNWVFGLDTPLMPSQSKNYFQVDGINEDGINCWRVEGFDTEYATFEPIPLTPEVLLAAGFEWSIYHQAFRQHQDVVEFYYINECYPKGYQFSTFKKGTSIGQPFFYLHQLQNIYQCLCGEELEIDIDTLTKAIK